MTLRGLWTVLRRALAGWWNDNVPHLGAALSYYTLFSLAPILIVAIAIAGTAFGQEAVRGEIVHQIDGLVGHEGAIAVQAMLQGAAKPSATLPATIIGIITFFLGATGAFLELQTALNTIWRVKPKSDRKWYRVLLVERLTSFGLVVGVGFLMLTSLLVSAALAALYQYM
jgi:membrane protein